MLETNRVRSCVVEASPLVSLLELVFKSQEEKCRERGMLVEARIYAKYARILNPLASSTSQEVSDTSVDFTSLSDMVQKPRS
jgi:hypothetical protein